jgi:methylated-DNA-protein-cysteine methyltransferase-like protein
MVTDSAATGTAPDQPRDQLWQLLAAIPRGRVTSYGRLAALAGAGNAARWVGRQLAALPSDSALPWHRVVSSSGVIAARPGAERQLARLAAEGVICRNGRLRLADYLWEPA